MQYKLLFLQLPRLDNDVSGAHEEARLAEVYLRHTVEKSGEARHYRCGYLKDADYRLDDAHLARKIIAARPDVIAATLYLWNIERTLDILRKVRVQLPQVKIIVGGPEVARDHPFLFRSLLVDAAVSGEGEIVLPVILNALRKKWKPNLSAVGWRQGKKYVWGKRKATEARLKDCLPAPGYRFYQPDERGSVYMETTRGCPKACIFCRYGQERSSLSHLPVRDVLDRIARLHKKGAQEIRFIDPTFNASPCFNEIIQGIVRINRHRKLRFFAELLGDTLTSQQIKYLRAGGFEEVEIGVQSCDRNVLRKIRRHGNIKRIAWAVRRLLAAGIKVTLDLMYPLPGQSRNEVINSIRWARKLRGVRIQCLQTCVLPGTELRRKAWEWKMRADNLPPYLATATGQISAGQLGELSGNIRRLTGTQSDCPTDKFVGADLPDLFQERYIIEMPFDLKRVRQLSAVATDVAAPLSWGGSMNLYRSVKTYDSFRRGSASGMIAEKFTVGRHSMTASYARILCGPTEIWLWPKAMLGNTKIITFPGSSTRRALVFKGTNLFGFRRQIAALIRKAVQDEPHILWQFVLAPAEEEPLDLVDFLVKEIQHAPEHINDRWIRMETGGKLAARRLFILLARNRSYSKNWIHAAESLLHNNFH